MPRGAGLSQGQSGVKNPHLPDPLMGPLGSFLAETYRAFQPAGVPLAPWQPAL